jgi:hypothetical protein
MREKSLCYHHLLLSAGQSRRWRVGLQGLSSRLGRGRHPAEEQDRNDTQNPKYQGLFQKGTFDPCRRDRRPRDIDARPGRAVATVEISPERRPEVQPSCRSWTWANHGGPVGSMKTIVPALVE